MFFMDIPEALDRCRQHRRHGQEEREFRCCLAGQLLDYAPQDGSRAPAETREDDRQDLVAADDKSIAIGHLFLVVYLWLLKPVIGEKEKHSTRDHHPGYK